MGAQTKVERADVAIAGAGFVGLALGAVLARAGLDVVVVDPALSSPREDWRSSALVAGSRNLLEQAGAWEKLLPQVQPVARMEIADSRLADVVRAVMLRFEGSADEPVAYIARNSAVRAALMEAAREAGVRLLEDAVQNSMPQAGRVDVELRDGTPLSASLLVAAEGARSPLREAAGIKVRGWRYHQSGIVTTLGLERPHEGVAIQHFLEGGPFALLPLPGNRASLVCSEPTLEAERLLALPDAEFLAAIQQRAGYRFGALTLEGPRALHPLSLHIAESFVAERLALIGDAAHICHPLAGQGLNIGLRDVAALAECVADAARLGGDVGATDVLQRYERWRRFDTVAMLAGMDGLLRLFSVNHSVPRLIRDAGAGLVDRMPLAKEAIMKAASGLSGEVPRLLKGEAL